MKEKTEISQLAVKLADECAGLAMIDADRALDDARRYLWIRRFSGVSKDALMRELAGSHLDTALRIAGHLDSVVTTLEAESLFTEARLYLWMKAFAAVPESLFAKQFEAYAEVNDGRTIQ